MIQREALGRCALFAGLGPSARDLVASLGTVVSFQTGERIFSEGDEARDFFVIHTGRVALEMRTPKQGEELPRSVVVAVLGAGESLGWSALVPPYVLTMSAVCVEPTVLVAISGSVLRRLMSLDWEIGYPIMAGLVDLIESRMAQVRARLTQMQAVATYDLRSPAARVAGYLEAMLAGTAGDLTDDQRHILDRCRRRLADQIELLDRLVRVSPPVSEERGGCVPSAPTARPPDPFEEAEAVGVAEEAPVAVVGAAMVVGGGIAGIQAALDLADAGIKVHLVERGPAIGGRMATLDKTFPTNDCAMCILAPKLSSVGRHPNIDLLTLTELEGLEGSAGEFRATVRRRPRFVNPLLCTACGECAAVCPVRVPSEFDSGLSLRTAVFRPYAQAVPAAFAITKRAWPPCRRACPIHQNAQGYVALIAAGKFREALGVILRDNPLPSICGRVCTHPCTVACTRGTADEPLDIPGLKRFVTDMVGNYGLPRPEQDRPERVAIVGSGPAGLMCAYELRQRGYWPVVFEAQPVAGGMLAMGIPAFRLPRDVLSAELDRLTNIGIEIRLNTPVGQAVTLEELRREYPAVFIAIGAHVERKLGIPGEDLPGVWRGVEFLRKVNLDGPLPLGRRVLVIGGGNSALDAARTALRCGAEEVAIVYRRTRAEMPADPKEVEEAEHEGIKLLFLAAPNAVLGDQARGVTGLKCLRMKLGPPDATGRPAPEQIPGSEFDLQADAIVVTIGQVPNLAALGERMGLETTRWGTFKADEMTLETNVPGVFAGGDCVTGPNVVVNAMYAGKKAAITIDRYLNGQDLRAGRELEGPLQAEYTVDVSGVLTHEQVPMPSIDLARRRTFDEVHTGYTDEMAKAEARRCLDCAVCSECLECVLACQRQAINHAQTERVETLRVGAVVLAPGIEPFDAALADAYGVGRFPNVLTGPQFERLLSASGPTQGHVVRPSDGAEPRRIAFLQCVGSRDQQNRYCSSVCCMYATKEAMLAREHLPEVECTIYYADMRAFGKGFDAYLERAKSNGVRYVRTRVASLREDPYTRSLVFRVEENGVVREEQADLVVLAVGLTPPKDADALARAAGIALNKYGFAATVPSAPMQTSRPGVFVAGGFRGPKDIPDSVLDGSGAAAAAMAIIGSARGTQITPKTYPPEMLLDPEPRIGVFVCHCGSNIAGVVDVAGLAAHARTLPGVVLAETSLYTCSADTLIRIKEAIIEEHLNRVVVASCTPRTHEPIFRETLREAGLNPYLFEMANIRDQCSWVHRDDPTGATEKAKALVAAAVARAARLSPLHKVLVPMRSEALVIGGGVAGLTASLNLAEQGFSVVLVERSAELGGRLRSPLLAWGGGAVPSDLLRELVERVTAHPRVRVLTSCKIKSSHGTVGNFETTVVGPEGEHTFAHGVTIIATGLQEWKPAAYGVAEDARVVTLSEFEARLTPSSAPVGTPTSVVMMLCAGPWDHMPFYCSRTCCAQSMAAALAFKRSHPEVPVTVIAREIRTYGTSEELFTQARQAGIVVFRYSPEEPPRITRTPEAVRVTLRDQALGEEVTLDAGLLVVVPAQVPTEGALGLTEIFKVPASADGFFLEAHVKLRPAEFASEGLFLCGGAHYPKPLDEAIAQSLASAARASTLLWRDSLEVGGVVTQVDRDRCTTCLTCLRVCAYDAISFDADGIAVVEPTRCQGCGLCVSVCPGSALGLGHYSREQMISKIKALLGEMEAARVN